MRAVFFDVDDTLVDWHGAAEAAHRQVFGSEVAYRDWVSMNHYSRFATGEWGFEEMRTHRMSDFLSAIGRVQDVSRAAELEARRMELIMAGCALFDDVEQCLALVRDHGLLVGLITNNDSVHQREKLRKVGLIDRFDTIVISGEVGVWKPDSAIFEHACLAVGVRPEQAMHVGDLLDVDAQAAQRAGLHGVWLDRHGRGDSGGGFDPPNAPARPVSRLRGLIELEALLIAGSAESGATSR